MALGPTARRVLGLPDAADWQARRDRRDRRAKARNPAAGVPAQPVNPWETAARQLQDQRTAQTTTAPASAQGPRAADPSGPAAPPWVTVPESSGSAFARRLGRGALWTLVAAFALLGAKSVLLPKTPPPPAQTTAPPQSGPAYPADQARAAAARFARSYLAWDEQAPQTRAAGLAAVLPDGADTEMGWNGKGRQEVLAVEPGTVTAAPQRQARVRVDVLVRSTVPPVLPARWVGLDVPVVAVSGQVVVTGPPGLVGIPATGPAAPELPAPAADSDLTGQTAEAVRRFFAVYADGGDTEAVTAPGASVPPLPAGFTLTGVTSWTAHQGSGATRTGTALVTWQTGGAQIEQTYRVELTRVASADAQRWQVAAVHGGTA
ncbi:hypothetical protein [Streptomyces sp. NPDC088557]|uniref:hypothetical protein n=1 Tax=Streptomyces sp. NPDC088557 TaxID=3365867 RepID=UPI00381FBB08